MQPFCQAIVICLLSCLLATSSFAAPTKFTVDATFSAGCTGGNCQQVTEALAVAVSGDLIVVKHNAAAYVVGAQTVDTRDLQFIGENAGVAKAILQMHLLCGADSGKWVFTNFAITNDADEPFIELQGTTGSPKVYLFDVDLNNFATSTKVVINTRGTTTTGSPTVIIGFGSIVTHKVIDQNDDTGNVQTSISNCQISGLDQINSFLFEGSVAGTFTFKGNVVTSTSTTAPQQMYATKTTLGTIKHFFTNNHFDFDALAAIDHELLQFETAGTASAFLSFYNNNMDMNTESVAVNWDVTTTADFYFIGEENKWNFNGVTGADEVFPIKNGNGNLVAYVKGSSFLGRTNAAAVAQVGITENGVSGYICLTVDQTIFFPDAPLLQNALTVLSTSVLGNVELKATANAYGTANNRVNLILPALKYVGTGADVSTSLLLDSPDLTALKIQASLGSVINGFDSKCNGGGANPSATLPKYRMPTATADAAVYNGGSLTIDVNDNDVADPQNEALTVMAGSSFSARGYVPAEVSGNIQYSNSANLAAAGTGADVFFYILTDVSGGFDVGKVSVSVSPTKFTVDATFAAGCTASGDCQKVSEALAVAATGDLIIVKHNAAAYVVGGLTVDDRNLQFIGEDSAGGAKAALNMHIAGGAGNGKWVFSNFAITNDANEPFIELKDTTGSPKIYFFDLDLNNVATSTKVVINTRGSTTTGSPIAIIGFGKIETHKVIDQHEDTGNVQTSIVNTQISGIDQTNSFLFEGDVTGSFTFKGNVVTSTSTNAPQYIFVTKTTSGTIKHFISLNHFDFDGITAIDHELLQFETGGDADAFLSFYKNNFDLNTQSFAVKWDVTTTGNFYYVGEENIWDFNDVAGVDEVFPINNGNGNQVIYIKSSSIIGRTNAAAATAQIIVQSNGATGYICLNVDQTSFFVSAAATQNALSVVNTVPGVELKTTTNNFGTSDDRVSLASALLKYIGDTTLLTVEANLLNDNTDLTAAKVQAALGTLAATFDAKCNGGGANPSTTLPKYRMPFATADTATYNGVTLTLDVKSNDIIDPQSEAFTVLAGSLFSARGYVTAEAADNKIEYSNSANIASSTSGSDTFYYVLTDTTGGFDVGKSMNFACTVAATPPNLAFNVINGMKLYIPSKISWIHNLSSDHKVTIKLYKTDRTTFVQTWFTNRAISPTEAEYASSHVNPTEHVLKAETTGPTGTKVWWSNNFYILLCNTFNPTRVEICRHL